MPGPVNLAEAEGAAGQSILLHNCRDPCLSSSLQNLSVKSCLFSPPQGDDGEVGPRGLPGEPVSPDRVLSPQHGDGLLEEATPAESGTDPEHRLQRGQP